MRLHQHCKQGVELDCTPPDLGAELGCTLPHSLGAELGCTHPEVELERMLLELVVVEWALFLAGEQMVPHHPCRCTAELHRTKTLITMTH